MGQALIDTQFQYWMTITFAVVVAGFAAGDRLSQRLRYVVLVLYGLAAMTLFLRMTRTGESAGRIMAALAESESLVYEADWFVVVFRSLTFFLGTLAASVFLVGSGNTSEMRRERDLR